MSRTLYVTRPFNLLLNDDEKRAAGVDSTMLSFGVGRHDDVPDVVADHAFVRLNTGTEQEVSDALRPILANGSPLGEPMVAQSVHDEVLAHADGLRARIGDLEKGTQVQGASIAAMNTQLGEANRAREAAETALQAERDAHAETRAMLDQATAPQGNGEGDEQDEPAVGNVSVRHKGRGLFAVFRGEEQVGEPKAKEAAHTEAEALRAQG